MKWSVLETSSMVSSMSNGQAGSCLPEYQMSEDIYPSLVSWIHFQSLSLQFVIICYPEARNTDTFMDNNQCWMEVTQAAKQYPNIFRALLFIGKTHLALEHCIGGR